MNQASVPPLDIRVREIPGDPILAEPVVQPCVMVIFGATGDLTKRKLVPALYNLKRSNSLPNPMAVVGVARGELSVEAIRSRLRQSIGEHSRSESVEKAVWEELAQTIDYIPGDFADPKVFQTLREKLDAMDHGGTRGNRVFYLASPPSVAPQIIQNLRRSGLIYECRSAQGEPWSRVIIEKPFGRDLESARQLNELVGRFLDERQTYRIDHYLGKETVQNILVFRFGNSLFEQLWNRKYIDHIQVTAAESIGVEGRGAFYDSLGVFRDIFQNHLLELIALCTMETPLSFSADDIRDQKVQLLRALRMPGEDEIPQDVVQGQYKGYLKEKGVKDGSQAPTFMAMKVMIDNWRWQGVPIFVRAGKGLARRKTEISVHFQPIPISLFHTRESCQIVDPNVLILRIQPHEGISLKFSSKVPGDSLCVGSVSMDMSYASAFGRDLSDAYERLLLDCMRGDATLFTRRDEVEVAWRFVTPILEVLEGTGRPPLAFHEMGAASVPQADQLIRRHGRRWRPLDL